MDPPRTRLGIIGLGTMGSTYLRLIRSGRVPDFDVVAAADPRTITGCAPLEFYTDYRQLLMRHDVDAIAVSTPPHAHQAITIRALKAGKHVLVEKPPALTVEGGKRMVRTASKVDNVLFMAFHARYHASIEALRQELATQEIRSIDIRYKENVLNYHRGSSWVFDRMKSGGGALMDSGINAVSVVTYLLPRPTCLSVTSSHICAPAGYPVETNVDVGFRSCQGTVGRIRLDWLHAGTEMRQFVIHTTNHEYTLDVTRDELCRDGEVLVPSRNLSGRVDQFSEYEAVFREFGEHISSHRSLVSISNLAFICAIYARDRMKTPCPAHANSTEARLECAP